MWEIVLNAGIVADKSSLLAGEAIKREEELVYDACKNFKRYMVDVLPQGASFSLYETFEIRSKLYQLYQSYLNLIEVAGKKCLI